MMSREALMKEFVNDVTDLWSKVVERIHEMDDEVLKSYDFGIVFNMYACREQVLSIMSGSEIGLIDCGHDVVRNVFNMDDSSFNNFEEDLVND